MNIDWSKSPEWAVAHALHAFGGEISEVWVGEEQYQRLDQSKPFPYGGGSVSAFHNPRRYQFRYETLRPSPWIGEGLPPVGTVCEYKRIVDAAWKQLKVKYHGTDFSVLEVNGDDVVMWNVHYGAFRPIRTPEQIAAEECRAAVNEIGDILIANRGTATEYHQAGLIYAAGYRKQVTP